MLFFLMGFIATWLGAATIMSAIFTGHLPDVILGFVLLLSGKFLMEIPD